jgi:hyperosmotically inducible periplasmic protein
MRIYGAILLGLFVLTGCEPATNTAQRSETDPDVVTTRKVPADADNTGVNERDRDDLTKTPFDQEESEADVTTTAEIRKRIVGTPDMSVNGQNVKVITADGRVTLRGPVANDQEREIIENIARDVAGADKVDNQLEVAP